VRNYNCLKFVSNKNKFFVTNFWSKFRFFLRKICFFWEKFVFFWEKFFLGKMWIFGMWKCGILSKIWNFEQNLEFWAKCGFLTQVWIFDQHFDFWHKCGFLKKKLDFSPKFGFLNNILIFQQNFDFWPRFWFLTKISSFTQNFDIWQKILFLPKVSISIPKFIFSTKNSKIRNILNSSYCTSNRNISISIYLTWRKNKGIVKNKEIQIFSKKK